MKEQNKENLTYAVLRKICFLIKTKELNQENFQAKYF
jgi:hypothetical protein